MKNATRKCPEESPLPIRKYMNQPLLHHQTNGHVLNKIIVLTGSINLGDKKNATQECPTKNAQLKNQ